METFLECESIPIHSSVFQHPFISRRGISDSFHTESNGKNTELEISDNLLLSKATFTCLPSLGESSISASGLGRYANSALVDQVINTEDEYQYKPCGSLVDNSLSHINTTLRRTRVIKHKPSAITFPDISLETKICEILDDETTEEKLSIDEEVFADDDDVFTDLPTYHLKFTGIKRRRSHPRNRNGNHLTGQGDQLLGNIQCENDMAEEERKRKKLTEERSQWNKSMISLMRKLEQLNVDIEDAITATASFSHVTFSDVPKEMVNPKALDRQTPELEAKEACDWLRAAGFPQYAQLYEDSQFPIDIASVKRDHDFLDRDHVEPLCRRLNTLNKCASMKLDVNFQRKKSEDSDEEDLCAISDKWTFQRLSRRWSRVEDIDSLFRPSKGLGSTGDMKNTTSSESVLTDLSEPEICSIHSGSSGGSDCRCSYVGNSASRETFDCSENMCMPDSNSVSILPPYWPKDVVDGKHEKPSHTKAKTLLKCMETLRTRGTLGKSKSSQKTGGLVISDPVLQLEHASLNTMNCAHVGSGQMRDSLVDLQATGSLGSRSELRTGAESGPESNKRGGMYLGDIDLFAPAGSRVKAGQIHKNEFHSQEDLVVHIPKDYKPGTFPKALSIESLSPTENCGSGNWQAGSISQTRQADLHTKEPNIMSSRCPRSSRISVYDNVPGSHLYASTGDLMDLEKDDLFPHLDDVLQHINGLQQSVDHWSRDVMPELQDDDLSVGESGTSVFLSPNTLTLDFEGNSISDGRTTPSDLERDAASLNESDTNGSRERRDSGVGASLTRTNGRLRRPSFPISDQLNGTSASLQISHQTAGQLNLLQKFSLLHLTVIMEKYSMSNKHGWTWSVPKFMKRMKGPDYKDKNVFGVPLMVHVQRTGQPLPQCIQQALKFLRSNCLDQVGLFRKSGVKSRIQALRQMNETYPENVNYEEHCAYDVADMVKQFFRDLPEPLLTSKLGETFLHIYQYVPKDQRLQALQSAIMLMSDENREVLQTLLCFLRDVTSVEENQMTPMNLAVCLAPSLFHLNLLKKDNSPRAIQKKYNTGKPDQKDLNENLAATQGLAHMIMECNKLFEVPHEIISQSRNSYAEADVHIMTMEKIGKQMEKDGGNFSTYFENIIQGLLKEAKDKFKGWVSLSSTENTDLAYKKVGDGNPLRFWKVAVEVEAPPSIVLNRILREQHLWDDDYLQSKVIETIDSQTEVYQFVQNSMAPHPSRDFVVLRSWRMDLPKGMCTLVASSVEHEEAKLVGGVRAAILDERYLIEPCGSGKSRMTRICRVDLKGHCPEWYNKCFGHLFAAEALRIRNSFHPIVAGGPETKI